MKKIEEQEIPIHHSKKDTRRWCKGKVGKEHSCSWKEETKFRSFNKSELPLILSCDNCGKQFKSWWPYWDKRNGIKKPIIGSKQKV